MSSERIKSWPTKERPREQLLAEGPERLTDAELPAIILRSGMVFLDLFKGGNLRRDLGKDVIKRLTSSASGR